MTDSNKIEVIGKFRYEQDSKRYHRFKIETNEGIIGNIYVPKNRDGAPMPIKLILEYANWRCRK
jgi:hypothetical protein